MADKKSSNPLTVVLGLSAIFFIILLIVSGILSSRGRGSLKVGTKVTRSLFNSEGMVGILEINGIIIDSKKVLARLERLEESDQIKSVVLRLNSPGGSVAPSQEIYEAVRAFKKPLVVSMASVAASGAYYIASGAKLVMANPGTMTGSIGVIMEFMSLEKLYGWAKIHRYSVKSGKFKDIGAEYREMTSDEKDLLQAMVGDILGQFRQAIVAGRGLKMEHVVALSDGRIFSGKQAKDLGLIDQLGTFQDAIKEAGKLGGITGKPAVYYIEKPKSVIEKLFGDSNGDSPDSPGGLFGLLRNVLVMLGRLEEPGAFSSPQLTPRMNDSTFLPGPYLIWGGVH